MSLYKSYNTKFGFNREVEFQKYSEMIVTRCNNLIVCGDKLPYYIHDIKPHKDLNKSRVLMDLTYHFGIVAFFEGESLKVSKFAPTLTIRVLK